MAKGSIVDWMKEQGQDSSYANRKKLAAQYGIENYSGTAAQNTALLGQLQKAQEQIVEPKPQAAPTGPVAQTGPGGQTGPGSGPLVSTQAPGRAPGYAPAQKRPSYNMSNEVEEYKETLQNLEGNRPDAFESKYEGQIQQILDGILNREDFSYNMNNDQLYQQYKDSYMRQGQQAMRDTIGIASGMTGGYGSTYAQTAGSQAYDQHLAALNDRIPELYQLAYNQYLDKGQEMYNQLGALQGLDSMDYDRYRDTVGDYYSDLNYYSGRYNQEYGNDYGQFMDELAQKNWEAEMEYQREQDALAQDRWEQEFAYQKEQDALANALAQQKAAASGGGSGRSSGSRKKSSSSSKKETSSNGGIPPYSNEATREIISTVASLPDDKSRFDFIFDISQSDDEVYGWIDRLGITPTTESTPKLPQSPYLPKTDLEKYLEEMRKGAKK